VSKLKKVIDALVLVRCPAPENKEDPVDLSPVSYVDVIEALEGANIKDLDVLNEFRKLIVAEIAFGAINTLEGGPANAANTLRYEGISVLVRLYRDVLEAISVLRRNEHDEQGAAKEPGEAPDGPVPGGGEDQPEDPGGDGDAGDLGGGGGGQAAGEEEEEDLDG
jgi:hypothetical protein